MMKVIRTLATGFVLVILLIATLPNLAPSLWNKVQQALHFL